MRVEVGVEVGATVNEFPVFYRFGISVQIPRDVPVTAKKSTEVRHLIVHRISIAAVFRTVEARFLMHECIRVSPQVVANPRIVLKKSLKRRVVVDELAVICQ